MKRIALLVAMALLAGCHAAPVATDTRPVSTTMEDAGGVIPRFVNEIWPAIDAYNGAPDQGSDGYRQYNKIIDKTMDANGLVNLRSAVEKLGVVQEGNQTQGDIRRDDALRLSNTDLTVENSTTATLQVCYTYTADTRRTITDPPAPKPFASEATIGLVKTDNWYLHSITNDHVIASCQSSQA